MGSWPLAINMWLLWSLRDDLSSTISIAFSAMDEVKLGRWWRSSWCVVQCHSRENWRPVSFDRCPQERIKRRTEHEHH
jgi:hypothetical protein